MKRCRQGLLTYLTLSSLALAAAIGLAACADDLVSNPETLDAPTAVSTDASTLSRSSTEAEVSGYYVVVFKGKKLPKNAAQIVAQAGGELVQKLPEVAVGLAVSDDPGFASVLKGSTNVQAADPLRAHALPDTEAVQESHADAPTAADDLYYAYQWDIRRVHAPKAWKTTSGSHETVVGIIDTGIAWNHPDLAPNVVYTACYSVVSPSCTDYPGLDGHGTHVAGTVAAAFDHGRAVGVGPDLGLASYNVFEVFDTPDGPALGASDFAIWQAMIDAAEQDFDVVNMSLGGYGVMSQDAADWVAWKRVADYVSRQGVVIVASAGNGAANLNGQLFHIPGDVPSIINVGATGIRPEPAYPQPGAYDVLAYYSNYGAPVTLVAPGGDCGLPDSCDPAERPDNWFEYLVLSTYVVAAPDCAETASCPTGYTWVGGTSQAAPHVAGVAGLVRDVNPDLNANQVEALLKRTAEKLGSRQLFGHGMVDAAAAVSSNSAL